MGEDVEDEIDPDYSNMDLFDDPEDDGPGAGAGLQGEDIAQVALYPKPYTLHPAPYTLHPTPYTLHPNL